MALFRGCSAALAGGARRGMARAAYDPSCGVASEAVAPPPPRPAGGPRERSLERATRECDFDFKKRDVWPYDDSCGCEDPPPLAGCEDVGKPRQVCCRSIRQYGCHCEEVEEQCEEEPEPVRPANKECALDFRKPEVDPFDEPCGCTDPPPAASCETLNQGKTCCRTSLPHGCKCDSYDQPGLECVKQSAPPAPKKNQECGTKRPATKCS